MQAFALSVAKPLFQKCSENRKPISVSFKFSSYFNPHQPRNSCVDLLMTAHLPNPFL